MKIVSKPIDMVVWFNTKGEIHPVRFRMEGADEAFETIKIDKIIKKDIEKLTGNLMMVFTCKSLINGVERLFEIKYEIKTFKWILFKI